MVHEGSRTVSGACNLWASRTNKPGRMLWKAPNPVLPTQSDSQGSWEIPLQKARTSQTHQGIGNPGDSLGQDWHCWTLPEGWQCPPCTQERSSVCEAGALLSCYLGAASARRICVKLEQVTLNVAGASNLGNWNWPAWDEDWWWVLIPAGPPSTSLQLLFRKYSSALCRTLFDCRKGNTEFALALNDLTQAQGSFTPASCFSFLRCFSTVDENMLWLKPCLRLREVSVACKSTKA